MFRGGVVDIGSAPDGEGRSSRDCVGGVGGNFSSAAVTGAPPPLMSSASSRRDKNGVARTSSSSRRRWAPLVACAAVATIAALHAGLSSSGSFSPDDPSTLMVTTMLMRDARKSPLHSPSTLTRSDLSYNLTDRQAQQVNSFRSGKGLLLHLHLTHHAGTAFCSVLGASPAAAAAAAASVKNASSLGSLAVATGVPPFACRIDSRPHNLPIGLQQDPRYSPRVPWLRNETQLRIDAVRPYYHMVSFEFGFRAPPLRLQNTDWDNPNLVSVFVSRHPLERLLAGDVYVKMFHSIHHPNATHDDWWKFANMTHRYADNFMLRVLSNDPECCQGADTPRERLEEAIALLKRFTFVLDLRCLNEGMWAIAQLLGLEGGVNETLGRARRHKRTHNPDVSSRYPYRDVYEYLARKNQLDVELYEWTQQNALVRCPS